MDSQMAPPKQRLSKSVDTLSRVNHVTSLCPGDSPLCQSTPELPVACRRSALPRERSIWRRSITRMRDDLSQFGRYLRRSFTDGSDRADVVARIVPMQQSRDQDNHVTGSDDNPDKPVRRIVIGRSCRNRKSADRRSWLRDDGDTLDQPDHNFSSSLVLKSLRDGQFSAEISLRQLPPGDLIIYVRGHELEIVLERSPAIRDKRHRISVPSHQGVVELPIFVDENSLTFVQDPDNDCLVVSGRTKGCMSRRRSLSYSVLQSKAENKPFWKTVCRKLGFRRAKSQDSILRSQSMDDKAFKVKEYSKESVW